MSEQGEKPRHSGRRAATRSCRYQFACRKFFCAAELAGHIARRIGLPKAWPVGWQVVDGQFIVLMDDREIFRRQFTSNGVERILREVGGDV
jgi:hypothetical protein